MKRPIVYIAHRLGKDAVRRAENIEDAERWVRFFGVIGCAPIASWTALARGWSEEMGRVEGLDVDKRLVEVCSAIFLCGPELSPGMVTERDHGLATVEILSVDIVGLPRCPSLALFCRAALSLPRLNYVECWSCKGTLQDCGPCGSSGIIPKKEGES